MECSQCANFIDPIRHNFVFISKRTTSMSNHRSDL